MTRVDRQKTAVRNLYGGPLGGGMDDLALMVGLRAGQLKQDDVDAVVAFRQMWDAAPVDRAPGSGSASVTSGKARRERRKRERVTTPQGVERVQTKPPRADVLVYPTGWRTVLVRRTHDVEKARELAAEAWTAGGHAEACGALVRHRTGWWATTPARNCPKTAGRDEAGRVVAPCEATAWGAGPGIEWVPERKAA